MVTSAHQSFMAMPGGATSIKTMPRRRLEVKPRKIPEQDSVEQANTKRRREEDSADKFAARSSFSGTANEAEKVEDAEMGASVEHQELQVFSSRGAEIRVPLADGKPATMRYRDPVPEFPRSGSKWVAFEIEVG